MKNTIILLLISLMFTSCFEIKEEVNMFKDGSGEVIMTVDLSESKDNLKSYMQMEEFQGQRIPKPSEIDEYIERISNVLKRVEGLSNVQSTSDYEDFVFAFSGDFTDVDVLNKAVNTLSDEMSKSVSEAHRLKKDNFRQTKNQFQRLFDYPIDYSLYEKLGSMQQFVMESAHITSIYRFPQAVKSVSNGNAKLSSNRKAVMFRSTVAEIAKGNTKLANTISFF